MSKGLEALENIKGNCDLFDEGYQWDNEFSKQFDLDIDFIEKELKALEIIKNKGIAVGYIRVSKNVEEYNEMFNWKNYTQEEYDLLKEVIL